MVKMEVVELKLNNSTMNWHQGTGQHHLVLKWKVADLKAPVIKSSIYFIRDRELTLVIQVIAMQMTIHQLLPTPRTSWQNFKSKKRHSNNLYLELSLTLGQEAIRKRKSVSSGKYRIFLLTKRWVKARLAKWSLAFIRLRKKKSPLKFWRKTKSRTRQISIELQERSRYWRKFGILVLFNFIR